LQPDQSNTILQFLVGFAEREHSTTVRVLSAIPEDKSNYTPDPHSRTALDLAWHIASSEQFFMSGVINGEFARRGADRPESMKTPADIVAWYREQFAANIAKVKAVSPAESARIVNFFDIIQMPAVGFLQLMINHSVHHRGQLSAYLRPMGAKVPSIYGPSGDVSIQDAASA
jgi:uncharacterized damage-inducible protein DinB